MESRKQTALCNVCNTNKQNTVTKRLTKSFAVLCPECFERMKWVAKILEAGTNWVLKKYPAKYVRASRFSVDEL